MPTSVVLILVSTLAVLLIPLVVTCARQYRGGLQKEMHDKTAELMERIAQLSNIDEQFASTLVHAEDGDLEFDNLDCDFSFRIFDGKVGRERERSIKIKCPGVHHDDVIIDVVYNGCVVTIDRKASHGVDETVWVKRFQFKDSDGLFDLRDDQVTLDGGFLLLVFRTLPNRVFRFPKHFDMSAADVDDAWLYSEHCVSDCSIEPSIERASQVLRMAATTDEKCNVAVVTTASASSSDGVHKVSALLSGHSPVSAAASSRDNGEDFGQ